MADEEILRRKSMTFEQAEGVSKLPRQLARTEISPALRAMMWTLLFESVGRYDGQVTNPWREALRSFHIRHEHLMIDDFDPWWEGAEGVKYRLREIMEEGDYIRFYGFLQFMLREDIYQFNERVAAVLEHFHAGYRVVDGDTLVPVGSDQEAKTVSTAFKELEGPKFRGAQSHLRSAATAASEGDWASCIRESVNAVESVAKSLSPGSDTLGPALAQLENSKAIHPALKRGFAAIYGFTSDEKGLRHPLLDEPVAAVDETDALFMLGACSAFVTYLISRGRSSGIIQLQ